MSGLNPRLQAAMDAIHGDIANIGLPPIGANAATITAVREALDEPVTTPNEDLPRIVRARHVALAMIYSISSEPRVQEIARAGLYGHEPDEAA